MTDYTAEEIAEHRKQWADALKSGRYEQGKDFLLTEVDGVKRYCCLGVAAELSGCRAVVDHVNETAGRTEYRFEAPDNPGDNSATGLPYHAQKWLGIESADPRIGMRRASSWNDLAREPFENIGEMVETHDLVA